MEIPRRSGTLQPPVMLVTSADPSSVEVSRFGSLVGGRNLMNKLWLLCPIAVLLLSAAAQEPARRGSNTGLPRH